ncbi:serine/threonine protein kinase [Pendulispora rubella]|uniref:Serine/threonine protein kinase n=1 Tax=Pendulispora rubella TaxID=2741070 RepID=A0ABZ2LFD1_9BACT
MIRGRSPSPASASSGATLLAPGAVVYGRYELEAVLGEGGMGAVWGAHHTVTRRPVALKFLKRKGAEHARRFLREARIVGALKHPNVVTIYDILHEGDDPPVMVMDWLVGEPLSSRLAREGTIPLGDLARIMTQVADAVETAHRHGVVHRDLKPENIFLCRESPHEVKVLDFGIAKLTAVSGDAAKTAGLTTTGDLLGTPYYMAPEQVFGDKEMDHRADIWSLGVILHQCLTGRRPFDGENVGQILKAITMGAVTPLASARRDLPADLTSLVDRMLAREKEQRPKDLSGLIRVLSTISGVESTAPTHLTPARRTRTSQALWALGVLLAATAMAGAFLLLPAQPGAEPAPAAAPAPPPKVAPVASSIVEPSALTASPATLPDPADAAAPATTATTAKAASSPRAHASPPRRAPAAPPSSGAAPNGSNPRLPGGVYGESPYRP